MGRGKSNSKIVTIQSTKANEKRESGWLAPLILGFYTKCEWLALSSGRFIAEELALGIH
jgi:hypothetical protein